MRRRRPALAARQAVRLPLAASFADRACVGVPALTAHRCTFADGPVAGRTVLVTGGAGAVGRYAVQLASRAGATVIATASTADNGDMGFGAVAERQPRPTR